MLQKGLLPPTDIPPTDKIDIEPTKFQNLVSSVAGLQVHITTPGSNL